MAWVAVEQLQEHGCRPLPIARSLQRRAQPIERLARRRVDLEGPVEHRDCVRIPTLAVVHLGGSQQRRQVARQVEAGEQRFRLVLSPELREKLRPFGGGARCRDGAALRVGEKIERLGGLLQTVESIRHVEDALCVQG